MSTEFNITTVRKRFPSLNQPQVYFDNAGGSQILGDVVTSYETNFRIYNIYILSILGSVII
jgi:selenocysteine lyase/cysteine desulfurase